MTVAIRQDQIVEIAGNVWAAFLGMTPRDLETSESLTAQGGHTATATVHISGSWNGSVILSCSTMLSRCGADVPIGASTNMLCSKG